MGIAHKTKISKLKIIRYAGNFDSH